VDEDLVGARIHGLRVLSVGAPLPRFGDFDIELPAGLGAVDRNGLGPRIRGDQLVIRVVQGKPGVAIAAVEGGERLPEHLEIVDRHAG
jgi:hypothetical protein